MHSQIVQASAYFFYITHGLLISDPPIIFLGITSLLQSLVLIGQYAYYANKERQKEGDKEGEQEDGDSTSPSVAILGVNSV